MVAVVIVVVVGSLNDWQKERQFRKLNDKKEDRGVKVIRNGNEHIINIKVGAPLLILLEILTIFCRTSSSAMLRS
jgi:hypothetical protein